MLSRHLSQIESFHHAEQQGDSLPSSNRLLNYINECALVINQSGIILNFNRQSNGHLNPRTGTSLFTYLKSEDIEWLEACLKGEIVPQKMIRYFGGNKTIEGIGECISVEGEEYLFILKDLNHPPESLIYENIFNKAIHGLIVINEEGTIVRSNLFADELLKIKFEEVINLYDLLDQYPDESGVPGFTQPLAPHEKENMLSRVVRVQSRSYEFTKVDRIAGDYDLVVIRDISEEVNFIRKANEHDTLKVVGQLAAGIAHEIRNPMTSLKGFIQLLEPNLREHQKMYFEVINSELKRVETIMTEFLMLAKPKKSVFSKINLKYVIQETIEIMKPQATLHDLEIMYETLDGECHVFGDANRLKQVFINLIKNAIEATPAKGNIQVGMSRKASGIMVSVSDSGCGIPKGKLEKLKEPFFTTKENGTGLGLPVSLNIIAEHHGTVDVKSELNKGTIFDICLPALQ
ncbi:ATP-binding protein [Jeotgalibacillus terrae]|uniref:histidine kinase n=1 Tax=Jeotgalibacillus terrae TaxID=587735 RepID=A0ABW5ZFF7_9BACL|nr:ATP-binding protein [Jeotgalibacillus terrae]MBM7578293.1 two-component system, sporulation sensor kinase E [Jeotgalibacillus terrae]